MERRVLITGLGVLSPCGNTLEDFWDALKSGKSGLGHITSFDTTDFTVKIAGEVKNFDPTDFMDKKAQRRMDRFTQLAVAASHMAVRDSCMDLEKLDRERIGVILGSGIGGIRTHEIQCFNLKDKGPRGVSPFYIPMMIVDMAPGYVSMVHGFKGPNYATTSACASASHAIGESFKTIQRGDADMVITGGSEAAVTMISIGGFANMKALSTHNDDPVAASRPFDLNRDGFVLGEGSGIIVLESEESAVKRDAKIYGEIVGKGFTADAHHMTEPAPQGEGAVRSMLAALKDANMSPDEIEYINAHGTSTPYNDRNETMAIKTVFNDYAYKVPISSTKSMTGHLLGASGAIEFIASLFAMKYGCIPPTINYTTKDPDCDLDYVPNVCRNKPVRSVLSNTFGFGGHNASLIAREYN